MIQISQEAFEVALMQRHKQGTLPLANLVPAVYGDWTGPDGARSIDHLHLPGGGELTGNWHMDTAQHRADLLLGCPDTAVPLLELADCGVIRLYWLN